MKLLRGSLLAVCGSLFGLTVLAADAAPEMKTRLTERGKLLFSDDLNQPPSKEWRIGKGKWEVVDGALRGTELKADKHGATNRHAMPFRNVVIQFSFKLDGARQTTLSINDAKGHCCRVLINATGFTVQKDSHDHNLKDKAMVLEKRSTPIKPGEWHTIVVEIMGKEMLACLDGEQVAFGEHPSIDGEKANFGFTVAGESVSFKNLRVWEALPNKSWETTRAKLLAARGKSSNP